MVWCVASRAGVARAGVESAAKVRKNSLPSNALMRRWKESAGKPI